ncbi:carboxy methyl transferase for protein phosphatase 2A [Pestalotiopsis sp. 9143b]|nr:carboxy methyl transferase for protein phosphatase 2A [Pestalotiopsis sp. 9143b]
MSAPQIPNLLSLRGRGGGGLRGRGGAGAGGGRSRGGFASPAASHDATIQGTDTDASVSRLSAVDLGYLQDPFAQYFVQNGPPVRRLPIINRGTYTRTTALDRLVSSFLAGDGTGGEEKKERQIISLGAGTDTRPFRLFSQPGTAARDIIYHEVDFPAIAAKKRTTVQSVPALRSIIPVAAASASAEPSLSQDGSSWRSEPLPNGSSYYCHGLDLRDLARAASSADPEQQQQPPKVLLNGVRPDVPTLLISECCLCYLETAQARAVISHFAALVPDLAVVVYEPVRPSDPFGQQMVSNLAARRIRMPTLEAYREVADQRARLEQAGFAGGARALTVQDVWARWVSPEDKEAVDDLEGLDEVEEWELLASHYVVAWGWRGRGFEGWKEI